MSHKDPEYQKKYYQKNKEKRKREAKEYRKKYPERIAKAHKKYYSSNKDKVLKWNRERYRNHLKENPKHRLSRNISRAIRRSLKSGKNGKHWECYVDFTRKDLMKHIEKQFTPEMNWDNQGSFWHIDHIVPVSAFNYDNYNQLDFKRCWALENLRPLEKTENIRKKDKINGSFQPSLKIYVN